MFAKRTASRGRKHLAFASMRSKGLVTWADSPGLLAVLSRPPIQTPVDKPVHTGDKRQAKRASLKASSLQKCLKITISSYSPLKVLYTFPMDISTLSPREVGALGEKTVAEYLRRRGMRIIDRNVSRKTGEIDLIAREGDTLHFVEVKSILCVQFPSDSEQDDRYDPSANLHEVKIRRVARTSEWYVANIDWEHDWQVDGALVWLRKRDGRAKVRFFPQIL